MNGNKLQSNDHKLAPNSPPNNYLGKKDHNNNFDMVKANGGIGDLRIRGQKAVIGIGITPMKYPNDLNGNSKNANRHNRAKNYD